jgi:CHAT domain-containing protein
MHDFYSDLVQGQPTVDALRNAKTKMLKSPWAHPYYWASFLLQGDPSAAGTAGRDAPGSPHR